MTFTGIAVIKAPHFYAGVVVERDKIVKVPPNLKYMQPWAYPELKAFVIKHHWRIAEMSGAFRTVAVDQRDARQRMLTRGPLRRDHRNRMPAACRRAVRW